MTGSSASATAGSGYQSGTSSNMNSAGSSSSQTGQSTWIPNSAMDNNYGQANQQLDYLQSTPSGYFSGQTYASPSTPTQESAQTLYNTMGLGNTAMNNLANNAGASQGYYNNASQVTSAGVPSYLQAANSAQNASGTQQGINNMSLGNYGFLSNAADVANNPYVQGQAQALTNQLNQNFAENLLPTINQGANQVNALGSSRQGLAQAKGMETTQDAISEGLASLYGSAYNTGIGAQQNALSYTDNMLSNQLAPAQAQEYSGNLYGTAGSQLGKAGEYQQQGLTDYTTNMQNAMDIGTQGAENASTAGKNIESYWQSAIDDAVDRYNAQYEEPWDRLDSSSDVINSLFGALGTDYTSSTSQTTSQSSGKSQDTGYNLADEFSIGK